MGNSIKDLLISLKYKKRLKKIHGLWNQIYSFLLTRHSPWNAQILKQQVRKLGLITLHVGCGDILLPEWLNIRYETKEEYGRLKIKQGVWLLNYNLLKPWPFEDNSFQYIAGSHVIEHLDLHEGIEFLKEAFRVLKKGGVIRLSCPDLYLYARNYVENRREFFENELIREWCAFRSATTPGEIFIAKAYDSGGSHKWFYDFDSLKHILELAGFSRVSKEARLTGKVPDLEKVELPRREIETIYVEAVKL